MAIEIRCPGCQRDFRAPDSAAGKKGKCPQCGSVVSLPAGSPPAAKATAAAPAEKVSFPCPGCGKTMTAPASLAGKRGKCPNCQTALVIGGAAATVPQAAPLQPLGDPPLAPLSGPSSSLFDDLPPLPAAGSPLAPAAAPMAALPANNPLGITAESQRRWREAEAATAQSKARGGYAQPAGTPVKLMVPAIGMILISVISMGFQLVNAVSLISNPEQAPFAVMRQNGGQPINQTAYVAGAVAGAGIGILINLAVVAGAVQMIRMKGWDTAKAGAMVALIPCCSLLCLNIPLGVWALIVLNQDDVRRRFT